MSRPRVPEPKRQIAARVSPSIKAAIQVFASRERRTESQAIELLLEESPKIKAQLTNGNGSRRRAV
jgi:hypothetical protein